MPRGGKRAGAGRKKTHAEREYTGKADKGIATRVLELAGPPADHHKRCLCELCGWWQGLTARDLRVRMDTRKYLTDRREGKAAQAIQVSGQIDVDLNARRVRVQELIARLSRKAQ